MVRESPMPFGMKAVEATTSVPCSSWRESCVTNAFRHEGRRGHEVRFFEDEAGRAESPMPFGMKAVEAKILFLEQSNGQRLVTNAFRHEGR